MNIFVDENIEERYVEGLYEDFIFEEYEKIIFDYLANNCKEFDDEHIQYLVDLKVKQFFKLRQQIQELTNNWNELEEWLKNEIERFKEIAVNQGLFIDKELSIRLNARIKLIENILDKMKEIQNGSDSQ